MKPVILKRGESTMIVLATAIKGATYGQLMFAVQEVRRARWTRNERPVGKRYSMFNEIIKRLEAKRQMYRRRKSGKTFYYASKRGFERLVTYAMEHPDCDTIAYALEYR